jgi:hypothetical protein
MKVTGASRRSAAPGSQSIGVAEYGDDPCAFQQSWSARTKQANLGRNPALLQSRLAIGAQRAFTPEPAAPVAIASDASQATHRPFPEPFALSFGRAPTIASPANALPPPKNLHFRSANASVSARGG